MREGEERCVLAGESFECVEEFCCLGDMINACTASLAKVKSVWKKFRKLLPLLTLRGFT